MPLPTLWHDGVRPPATDGGALPAAVEVVVVGAGITGLTTAVLLARAGFSVAVLEARAVAAGTTGASTAKVSLLQGTMLARIARRHPAAVVDSYVEANRAAQTWLQRFCEEHAVPVQLRTAVTFAVGERGERDARAELEAARRAGLPVTWVDRLDLPFRTRGGVQLPDQLQTDPVALSHALVQDARAHGATVHEGVRVLRITDTPTAVVETDAGEVWADVVIIATGMPILDRGGFFARMEAPPILPAGVPDGGATAVGDVPVGGPSRAIAAGRLTRRRTDAAGRWRRPRHGPDGVRTASPRRAALVDEAVVARGRGDPRLVGAGPHDSAPAAVRRPAGARRRPSAGRGRVRQVGDDQRCRERARARRANDR